MNTIMTGPQSDIANMFKEVGRVVRIVQVGGRRVQRFELESSPHRRWVSESYGLNRRQLRAQRVL